MNNSKKPSVTQSVTITIGGSVRFMLSLENHEKNTLYVMDRHCALPDPCKLRMIAKLDKVHSNMGV